MTEKEVAIVQPGLYRLHWKDGGTSLAAIGCEINGGRWLAPTNWVMPVTTADERWWRNVKRVELLPLGRK
jgi:hypothetical protein